MFRLALGNHAELRPLEPWQATEFLDHLDRARGHIMPWVGRSFSSASDLDAARAVLQRYADSRARDAGDIFGIWRNEVLVGGVMFVSFDAASGSAEVGCWLEQGAEGLGLATAAATELIDWAINTRGLSRIEWQTKADNSRSISVAKRLGMHLDGTMREAIPDTPRGDLEIWSVLAEEWKALWSRPAGKAPVEGLHEK
jgi:RimJ/RimL family protein N-acetyltransferase